MIDSAGARPAGQGPDCGRLSFLDAAAAVFLVAAALFLRVYFLNNMEYKADERDMLYLAINLVRDHVPCLAGSLITTGHHNPPVFHYLLALPVSLSLNPQHAALFIIVLNALGVGLTYVLVARHAGRWAALAAGLLYACSPWAIRYAMKIWYPSLLAFFGVLLCLQLPGWALRGGWRRGLLIGVTAAILAQLHPTGAFLVLGLVMAGLILMPRLRPVDLVIASAAFFICWTPYLAYQMATQWQDVAVLKDFMNHKPPAGQLQHVYNIGLISGGLGLSEALGVLGPVFRAEVWPGWEWTFGRLQEAVVLGAAAALLRRPRREAASVLAYGDWMQFFLLGAAFGLVVVMASGAPGHLHYDQVFYPWPFVLVGLLVEGLIGLFPRGWGRKAVSLACLAAVGWMSLGGAVYYWRWQSFISATGGSGEYGTAFHRIKDQELDFINRTRPLPVPSADPAAPWRRSE